MTKRYSELLRLSTYDERLQYLRFRGIVGDQTFGSNRYFNQAFYKSFEWQRIRREIILRDNGCDLAIPCLPIRGKIMIHHLTPITIEDILEGRDILVDPENLICCSFETHNVIHFGLASSQCDFQERTRNDTSPWRNVV